MSEPILRCTWCCKDTLTKPCQYCGNFHTVKDRTESHIPEWSRKDTAIVECKVCDRKAPYKLMIRGHAGNICYPESNTTNHERP